MHFLPKSPIDYRSCSQFFLCFHAYSGFARNFSTSLFRLAPTSKLTSALMIRRNGRRREFSILCTSSRLRSQEPAYCLLSTVYFPLPTANRLPPTAREPPLASHSSITRLFVLSRGKEATLKDSWTRPKRREILLPGGENLLGECLTVRKQVRTFSGGYLPMPVSVGQRQS